MDDTFRSDLALIPAKFKGIAPTVVHSIEDEWMATWIDGPDVFTIKNLPIDQMLSLMRLPHSKK